MQNRAIGWYFETVNRLQYTYSWPHYLVMKSEVPDEKPIVLRVEKAIETGNFEERIGVISNTPTGDVRQCFFPVMKKRNYNVNNIEAGRKYVSAFIDFIVYLNNLPSGNS